MHIVAEIKIIKPQNPGWREKSWIWATTKKIKYYKIIMRLKLKSSAGFELVSVPAPVPAPAPVKTFQTKLLFVYEKLKIINLSF